MHNFIIKRLAAVLAVILCVAALAGCGQAASLKPPTHSDGVQVTTITGSCAITKDGNVYTVSGSIDVMNGTYIDVSVVAQNGMILAHNTILKSDTPISESFTLTDEQMEGVVDVKGYICCAPSYYKKQPSEVYDAYGKKFENLTAADGSMIWNNEGNVLTFASDWLNGVIPSPTTGPTPTATPETSTSASASASA